MATQSETIKSVSTNQHEILWNIMQMHNNGEGFECDPTYSIGNFYGRHSFIDGYGEKVEINIPQPKYKFDVFPQTDDTVKIEPLKPLPLEDNSVGSVVCDLPFVISCGPSMGNGNKKSNVISNRFSSFYPSSELYRTYFFWIKEISRVLKDNGICVFKNQPTISGGINHQIDAFSMIAAQECGMEIEDLWVLVAKNRIISGKVKQQQHARKYHSYFHVFRKTKSKKYKKLNYINMIRNLKDDVYCEDIYKAN